MCFRILNAPQSFESLTIGRFIKISTSIQHAVSYQMISTTGSHVLANSYDFASSRSGFHFLCNWLSLCFLELKSGLLFKTRLTDLQEQLRARWPGLTTLPALPALPGLPLFVPEHNARNRNAKDDNPRTKCPKTRVQERESGINCTGTKRAKTRTSTP